MKHRIGQRLFVLLAVSAIGLLAAALAACGDDDDSKAKTTPATTVSTPATTAATTGSSPSAATTATSASTASPTAAAATTVRIATVGTIGQVLTDPAGRTLYTFKNDTPGSGQSACTGGCATTWPAFNPPSEPVSKPTGASGDLAVITRADGTKQVTYKGSPLYRFSGDQAPGDAKGQGIGNIWFAAAP